MTVKATITNPHALQPSTEFVTEEDGYRTSVTVSNVTLSMLKKAIKEAVTDKIIDDLAEQIVKHSPALFSIHSTDQPIGIDVNISAIWPEVRVTTSSSVLRTMAKSVRSFSISDD